MVNTSVHFLQILSSPFPPSPSPLPPPWLWLRSTTEVKLRSKSRKNAMLLCSPKKRMKVTSAHGWACLRKNKTNLFHIPYSYKLSTVKRVEFFQKNPEKVEHYYGRRIQSIKEEKAQRSNERIHMKGSGWVSSGRHPWSIIPKTLKNSDTFV